MKKKVLAIMMATALVASFGMAAYAEEAAEETTEAAAEEEAPAEEEKAEEKIRIRIYGGSYGKNLRQAQRGPGGVYLGPP